MLFSYTNVPLETLQTCVDELRGKEFNLQFAGTRVQVRLRAPVAGAGASPLKVEILSGDQARFWGDWVASSASAIPVEYHAVIQALRQLGCWGRYQIRVADTSPDVVEVSGW